MSKEYDIFVNIIGRSSVEEYFKYVILEVHFLFNFIMLNAFNDITEKTFIKRYGSRSHVRLSVRHQFLVYEMKPTILIKLF